VAKELPHNWTDIRKEWPVLTFYQRFEVSVAYALTIVIGVVILVAFVRLILSVADTLVLRTLNPLDHGVFQLVFGEIMTLLIALEFNHTLRYVITGERGIIQARIVILIALLALARKVIIVDLLDAPPASVAALAALALSLGIAYWILRERDQRSRTAKAPGE